MKNKQKNEEENCYNWGSTLKSWLTEEIKFATVKAAGNVKERITEFFKELGRKMMMALMSTILVLIGIVFLMISFSVFLNEVAGLSRSTGYLISGLIALLIGVLVSQRISKST